MRFVLPLLLGLLGASCGGSGAGTAAKTPNESASSAADTETSTDTDPTTAEQEDSPAASTAAKAPSCDDGTCSPCGAGICPAGWYCDEGVSGGAACSWLKECADKPTCGCVKRVLGSSCQCREEAGGLKVSCG